MHDHDILLPVAGHQDHDAQYPDYGKHLPHRYVQVRAFSEKSLLHDHDILLPAAGHRGNGAQYLCNHMHLQRLRHQTLRHIELIATLR